MLHRHKRLASLTIVLLGFITLFYLGLTTLQSIQTVQHDSNLTDAFLQVISPAEFPSNALEPNPVLVTDLSQRPLDYAPRYNAPSFDDLTNKTNPPNLFDTLMTPFVNEARKRRTEFAKTDPDYFHRVDRELNEGRINFLLFGYGETHEPPLTEKAIIGSQTIISYNLRTRQADIISFTHDIRAPEIERELSKRGQKTPPVRIDQAYNVGGFKLMRKVMENATGLAIDFQITFRDSAMQGLVDGVFEGLDVDVPMTFDVHPFYLDGKKYEAGRFVKGKQKLNGRQVIQFIKTVPVSDGAYDKLIEHNARKSLVFNAILDRLSQKYNDHLFWLRGSTFVAGELVNGSIVYDFDPLPLLVHNIGGVSAWLAQNNSAASTAPMRLPKINQSKYIVDSAHGDGGVQWVTANAAINPITQKDLEQGVYTSLDMEVPIYANPYGDLVSEYWTSVRRLVRYTLTAKPSAIYNFPTP